MPRLHRVTSPLRPARVWEILKFVQILELLMYKRHARDYSSYTWLGDEQEQSYAYKKHLTPTKHLQNAMVS